MWRLLVIVAAAAADEVSVALEASDDCQDGTSSCALNALQLSKRNHSFNDTDDDLSDPLDPSDLPPPELKKKTRGRGWWPGGDKLWGSGKGLEDINEDNIGYYNAGMRAARARCGGPDCALIVNPMHHRTVEQFHIHFAHYQGKYGADLKSKLEKMLCNGKTKSAWIHGGLPCHGTASYAEGFPDVFSLAMEKGSIDHASVIAWPSSCGGKGTIIELAFHCSIEHQIRGDFDARFR